MSRLQEVEVYAPHMGIEESIIAGRYRLEEIIGRGGMKDVYRGRDLTTDERVAIARMVGADREQLAGEVAIAKQVQSPYVARIYDVCFDADTAYIVSELCTGPTLQERIDERVFTVAEALPIFVALARGVETIHEAHILHRDLKPGNVILREGPREVSVAILDFGISAPSANAKTSVGVLPMSGTLPYMAREIIRGEALDGRSDSYALGVCMFQMLTGRLPLPAGQSVFEYMDKFANLLAHDLAALPPLPAALLALLKSMLSMDQEQRPYMQDVRAALDALHTGGSVMASTPRSADAPPTRNVGLRTVPLSVVQVARIAHAGGAPETVVLSGWTFAPIVTLRFGTTTQVEAHTADGLCRFSTTLNGDFRRGVMADLDHDGVRELHLFGPGGMACVDARGRVVRHVACAALQADEAPTVFAVEDAPRPHFVVDGQRVGHDGVVLGALARKYEGDGKRLVAAHDGRGLAYNGYAEQSFRGAFHTPAAVLCSRDGGGFFVAQLEATERRTVTQVRLRIYGPGGAQVADHEVATSAFKTGDARAVNRFVSSEDALFDARQAPLGWERAPGEYVVVVPFLGASGPFAQSVVAFSVPEGRELWRLKVTPSGGADTPRGAVFADVDDDGVPELLVGTGEQTLVVDAITGAVRGELPAGGAPIAYGDPTGCGAGHLVSVTASEVQLWRGGQTLPGLVQWAGPRADRWRTGTRALNGAPLGPT